MVADVVVSSLLLLPTIFMLLLLLCVATKMWRGIIIIRHDQLRADFFFFSHSRRSDSGMSRGRVEEFWLSFDDWLTDRFDLIERVQYASESIESVCDYMKDCILCVVLAQLFDPSSSSFSWLIAVEHLPTRRRPWINKQLWTNVCVRVEMMMMMQCYSASADTSGRASRRRAMWTVRTCGWWRVTTTAAPPLTIFLIPPLPSF
jgi:hypothetical protein